MNSHLILASKSPRRKELLNHLGLSFSSIAANIDETSYANESPRDIVIRLSSLKAIRILQSKDTMTNLDNSIILGADTIVVANENILGKPQNQMDAYNMLTELSGKWHEVLTGVAIVKNYNKKKLANSEVINKLINQPEVITKFEMQLCNQPEITTDYEITRVHFRDLNQSEIKSYIESTEPYDKAGSYALQGLGACFVDRIEGCYTNVIGLPLSRTVLLLRKAGLSILNNP